MSTLFLKVSKDTLNEVYNDIAELGEATLHLENSYFYKRVFSQQYDSIELIENKYHLNPRIISISYDDNGYNLTLGPTYKI